MFYQYTPEGMVRVKAAAIQPDVLTIGYLSVEELGALCGQFGFDENTVENCRNAETIFNTGVEVYRDYTFTELRILNDNDVSDDYIALYAKKNLLLVIDISDEDGSTQAKYLSAVSKYPPEKISCERILAAFLDSLLAGDSTVLETIDVDLSEQEEKIIGQKVDKNFNLHLLQTKKQLTQRYSYYTQLMDIADAVSENDNDVFDEANLMYVDNVSKRIARLREDTSILRNTVEHLQDAYSSYLDSNMNNTMKIFTVLTSIFFPLTIIVGWYGMNFQSMPEFTWKYGYVYVILLSVVIVSIFAIVGKRKKWF